MTTGRDARFMSLDTIEVEQVADKITRRMVAGAQGMVVWWEMEAGAHVAAHSHPHEQIVWMRKGRMEVRLGDKRRMCGPGDLAVIPGGVEHEVWIHEDTDVIDIFAPPREDFLAGGQPSYMQKE